MKIETVEQIVEKAIPLSSCPVKKQHELARRIWLLNKINALLEDNKRKYNPVTETK